LKENVASVGSRVNALNDKVRRSLQERAAQQGVYKVRGSERETGGAEMVYMDIYNRVTETIGVSRSMAKHVMLVHINPIAGRDAEFNEWYEKYHLKEIMEIPGFVSGQRFMLSDTQPPFGESPKHQYLIIYEIDGEIESVAAALTSPATAKRLTPSDTPDVSNATLRLFTAIGPVTKAQR
jgi:hypothetical protein